jgi:hypothetical protein
MFFSFSRTQVLSAILALAPLACAAARVASAQETGTATVKQADVKPTDVKPTDVKPTDVKQADVKQADPDRFHFSLTDGSRITGKMSLSHIELSTEYGLLTVPIANLLQVVPGLDRRPEDREEIEHLMDMLGKNAKESEQAREGLMELGAPVRELLRQRREQVGEKQQAEIDKVLMRLDELAEEEMFEQDELIPDDTVRTEKFTAIGKLLSPQFRIETAYGDLTVTMADVERLERVGAGGLPDAHRSLEVNGTHFVQLRLKESGIEVHRGDKVVVRANGTISRSTSRVYSSTPDGNSRFGTYSQNPPILGGALVARIGKSGKILKVGSNSTFVAKQSGVLRFGIGMPQTYVGRYQFNGKYDVSVRVLRGEK